MAVDVSGVALITPILAYLLVAVVVGAVLFKTKILGENSWVIVFVSLFVATLFVASVGTRKLVETIVPWFAVLFISLFLVLFITAFAGAGFKNQWVGIAFVILLGIVFLVSAFVVFSDVLVNYLPGPGYGAGGDAKTLAFTDWLYSPRVFGAVLLVIASAVVAWVLVKAK